MPNVKVKYRETLLDVVILASGNISGIFEYALLNNSSITKDLVSGDELIMAAAIDTAIVGELKSRSARPASAIDVSQAIILEGIGYWRVWVDFIVNPQTP